jgi:hypothetical protein
LPEDERFSTVTTTLRAFDYGQTDSFASVSPRFTREIFIAVNILPSTVFLASDFLLRFSASRFRHTRPAFSVPRIPLPAFSSPFYTAFFPSPFFSDPFFSFQNLIKFQLANKR